MSEKLSDSQLTAVDFNPFEGPQVLSSCPSTEAQREIWTSVGLGNEASCAFNESISLHMKGDLHLESLKGAFQDLTKRHEALRASLSSDGSTLCIGETGPFDLPELDVQALDSEQRESVRRDLLRKEVTTPFSLEQGPLFRATLLRWESQEHWLVLTAHHIVCDGWSMAVMISDLAAFYTARVSGQSAQLAEASRFTKYAAELASAAGQERIAADEAYWLKRFADNIPVLDLPLDKIRPASRSFQADRVDHKLDRQLCDSIKQMGAKNGCSLFVTMLAAFQVFVYRLTGQSDIVVGVPAAGQSVDGLPTLVGHCVQMLPVRLTLRPESTFVEQLRSVRSSVLDAYDHQHLTFGTLIQKLPIQRDPSRLPLVSITLNVDQSVDGSKLGFEKLEVSFQSNPRAFENFELFINAAETQGSIVLECQYKTDLFERTTIENRLSNYEHLLRSLVTNPANTCDRVAVLTEAQKKWAVETVNATVSSYESSEFVQDLVSRQAADHPEREALVFGNLRVNYAELEARSNQLAHAIREQGANPGDRVGIYLNRSERMVIALLAVLKAGCAYIPLDPAYPRDRITFMMQDAKLRLVLTEGQLMSTQGDCVALSIDQLDLNNFDPKIAPSDSARETLPSKMREAYVIYTSGSTGKPKGVLVPHRAVVNFLNSMRKQPGLGPDDTLLAVTTLSFDIAVLELLLPLSVGARCVIASRDEASDGAALLALIHKESPTVMQATPSTWRMLLTVGWESSRELRALCGGEAMPRDLASELIPKCKQLWNMFGPTETTVWSSCQLLRDAEGIISIGRPIDNTQFYVLDSHLQPLEAGVVGELYIAGHGVTLGYLDRPELTAERFIPNPFGPSEPGASSQIYRTGDLARLLPDGTFEHLGRTDSQVKLRGFRIELGEIENNLRSHPQVRDAAALVRQDRPSDFRLVAYLVPSDSQAPDTNELRDHLRKTLPEYMIPQHFVELAALPLTPNGKVDRKQLPAPLESIEDQARTRIDPRDDTEKKVAAIWAQVLGISNPSVDDNFFQLGGHSLLATQLVARLAREHGIEIPLRKVFEAPTIQGLAQIANATHEQIGLHRRGIPKRNSTDPAPLSLMQRRLWYIDQVNPGGIVYNLPSAFRFHGLLNQPALQKALDAFLNRHEALRTAIPWHGDAPAQVVNSSLKIDLTPTDISDRPEESRLGEAIRLMRSDACKPFDLATGPLCRGGLFRLADNDHILYFTPHHSVFDGWSFDIFLRDMSELYAAACENRTPQLPDLPVQYGDFAEWQKEWLAGPHLERQRAYWTKQLGGQLPTLEIPTDRPRPDIMTFQGDTTEFRISQQRMEALSALARANGSTLYMVLLAAWKTLLHRFGGQNEILVGSPIQGRSHADLRDLVGFFANALVFRTNLSGDPSFLEALRRVREVCLDAYSHQDIPIELLVEILQPARDLSRSQFFQTFFTYQDVRSRPKNFGNLILGQVNVHLPASPTDLSIWFKERHDGVSGALDFALDLFDPPTAKALVDRYMTLLDSICENPNEQLSNLPILDSNQIHHIVVDVNASDSSYNEQEFVHDLISRQAKSTPNNVALVFGDKQVTYAQLEARANRMAHAIRKRGPNPGDLVGLYLNRSEQMVVALLAILKAGCAYVPLDPAYPQDRISFMQDDSAMKLILTDSTLVPTPGNFQRLFVDQMDLTDCDASQPPVDNARDSLPAAKRPAYVIYTSGSTGKPKGVVLPHRAVVNFLHAMSKKPGLRESDTILAVTTLSFDIAVLELLLPLTVGARCIIASRDQAADGSALKLLFETYDPTVLQATPSTWRILLTEEWQGSDRLRALCGGEAMPKDLAASLLPFCAELWNMFGPTETTVWSSCFRVEDPSATISIGSPIDNTQLYVLDAKLKPLPVGMPGELYIGGHGVALGYLNRPELTAERFIPNPFASSAGTSELLYRCGDLARLLPNGAFEHLGRTDSQVKLRGFRIELGEIESQLRSNPSIREAAVVVREDRPGDHRLVAYFVPAPTTAPTATDLRDHLKQALPDYMIPQHFVELNVLPLTPNGKLDRKKLPPVMGYEPEEDQDFIEPQTNSEKMLAKLWAKTIGIPRVGRYDNFFQLGGHSLLSMEVVAELRRKTGAHVSPRNLLLDTLEQVAAQIPDQTVVMTPLPTAQAPLSKPDGAKASLAKRLWGRLTGR